MDLLLNINQCDTYNNGIEGDPQNAYYSAVGTLSNLYALNLGLKSLYVYEFKNVKNSDLVRFDGAQFRNGCYGDSTGALYCHWDVTNSSFDPLCKGTMPYKCIPKIKRE